MSEEMKQLLDWFNEEKAKAEKTLKEIENRKEFTVASYHTGRAIAFSDCIEKIKAKSGCNG